MTEEREGLILPYWSQPFTGEPQSRNSSRNHGEHCLPACASVQGIVLPTVDWVLLNELSIKTIHHSPIWSGQPFKCPFSDVSRLCVQLTVNANEDSLQPILLMTTSVLVTLGGDNSLNNDEPQSWVADTPRKQSVSCSKILGFGLVDYLYPPLPPQKEVFTASLLSNLDYQLGKNRAFESQKTKTYFRKAETRISLGIWFIFHLIPYILLSK